MSNDLHDAHDYLMGPADPWCKGSLWKWVDNGNLVVWNDDSTIAFREELIEVLTRLAPAGLPPFGAILLLLSATRNAWPEGAFRLFRVTGASLVQQGGPDQELIAALLRGLHRVRALPEEVRTTPDGKAALAEVVFEGCTLRTPPLVTEKVLYLLRAGLVQDSSVMNTGASDPSPEELLRRDMQCLLPGLDRVEAERLSLRRKTGLEELPTPAEVDLPPGERVRALLTQLENDAELGGLIRLTRDLMAAMTLPRSVSDPDELPQGGVSDLTNRGPLDRLLLSELAHDDLTLAVRVATGSALYWRRERPPQPKPRMRSLLLESGLRSWGVPRVFATAVALAAAATVDKHTSPVCHRASGKSLVAVDLLTRAGLVAHLAALEPDVHPGNALPAFTEMVAVGEVETDVVLVLGEDVHGDRDFQRQLAASELASFLIVTVNREGSFTLMARSGRGTRILREAKLDLDRLFTPPAPKQLPLIQPGPSDRPAILRLKPFPLRLPHPIDSKRLGRIEGVGILTLTRDRRLMLWDRKNYAARQLTDDAPVGTLLWCSPDPIDDKAFAVVGNLGKAELTLLEVRLSTDEVIARPLPVTERSYRGVCAHKDLVFAIHKQKVEAFDLLSGEQRGDLNLEPSWHWRRDRFFYDRVRGKWLVLTATSRGPLASQLHDRIMPVPITAIPLFCPGIEGPIAVTQEGNLFSRASDISPKIEHGLKPPCAVRAISRRGDWIVFEGASFANDQWGARRVHLPTGAVDTVFYDRVLAVERVAEYVIPSTLRSRFLGIAADPARGLVLKGQRGRTLTLRLHPDTALIELSDEKVEPRASLPFKRLPAHGKYGYRLGCAEWPDGSRAFLDSRGLLHLQSSDRSIPEVTLVLRDGRLAGWCSDGSLFGLRSFTGVAQDLVTALLVWNTAIQPFVRRLT